MSNPAHPAMPLLRAAAAGAPAFPRFRQHPGKIRMMLAALGSVMFLAFGGCFPKPVRKPPSTLGALAPGAAGDPVNRVIIPETNGDAAYLVLGAYDGEGNAGSILLLRERLVDARVVFNSQAGSPYYGGSALDRWLNTVFWEQLSGEVRSLVSETTIEVTARSSVWLAGRDREFIARKVFALSMVECGFKPDRTPLVEGRPIPCLSDAKNRVAISDGEPLSWWLRTPDTRNPLAWVISHNGMYDIAQIDGGMGVRPAFCLNAGLKVVATEMDGRAAYRLSQ
ncbi:MAG: DUF6273 domain-containing protein [Opitutaceae bacterium]|jgi:hypothetical protein|nr:DUF6273 domain-containing protein [Opitutaceae bacterium]